MPPFGSSASCYVLSLYFVFSWGWAGAFGVDAVLTDDGGYFGAGGFGQIGVLRAQIGLHGWQGVAQLVAGTFSEVERVEFQAALREALAAGATWRSRLRQQLPRG